MSDYYASDFNKNVLSQDVFKQPKQMVRSKALEGERKERLKRWIHFMRSNPHRFVETYLGIHLHPYQILIMWVLQRSTLCYIVAARASAKTFMIAVYSLCLAILYPGIQIIACSSTLKQGGLIIEKITSLRSLHPNVAREIKSLTANQNTYEVIFHCGSTIRVVPSSESARGNRSNFIIVEESRLVDKDVLEGIIKPFLFSRTPPYRLLSAYKNDDRLKEEGIIAYITSAHFTVGYWYQYVKSCIKRMSEGDETANFLAFDYLITIYHNIKTEAMIKNEMDEADSITVQHEYLNLPSETSGKSYYRPNFFKRNIKRAFYPQVDINYNSKKNNYDINKVENELRIMSVDVATRANRNNDLTIIACAKLIPLINKGYERNLVYLESHKGLNTVLQAKRIKEIFFDFSCDLLVLDILGSGISVYDSLSQSIQHDERGITYPAMTIVGEEYNFVDGKAREDLESRTLGLGALQVIFPISASQQLNSLIAANFRSALQKKLWNFLIDENLAEEFLIKNNKEFMNDANDSETTVRFLNTYVQTSLFINECVNLDLTLVNGLLKLDSKPGSYKDRYSAISYMNYVISHLDKSLLKEVGDYDAAEEVLGITMVV